MNEPLTTEQILERQDDLADLAEHKFDPTETFGGPLLTALVDARKAADQAAVQIEDAVRAARAAGASWTVIGAALGVSRQAARQYFADRVGT
jgi:hypothetical protein